MDFRTVIYRYCNYQERCHQEVRKKLYETGARTTEVEELIAELIQNDLLNEERFAVSYARGKFRMLTWGKNKIRYHLKARLVSEYCIKKAMSSLDEEEYYDTLVKLVENRIGYYKEVKPEWKRKIKVRAYLVSRGFEPSLIDEIFKDNSSR